MKKLSIVAALLFAAACASTSMEPETTLAPVTPAPDPRVGELQTQLTELLERIDVLNHRIAQMEESGAGNSGAGAGSGAGGFSPPASQAVAQPVQQVAPPSGLKPAAPPAALQPQRAVIGADIAEDYRQAIMLVGRNRHSEARRAFEAVYAADPNGDLADNALFWIGETYFAAKDYTNAVRYYMRVVNDYSTQNKAPDALFKTAVAQERTGDLALARRTLQQVIDRYPYSTPASSAKAELERIKF